MIDGCKCIKVICHMGLVKVRFAFHNMYFDNIKTSCFRTIIHVWYYLAVRLWIRLWSGGLNLFSGRRIRDRNVIEFARISLFRRNRFGCDIPVSKFTRINLYEKCFSVTPLKKHSPAVICIPISWIEPELMGKCSDISLVFFRTFFYKFSWFKHKCKLLYSIFDDNY